MSGRQRGEGERERERGKGRGGGQRGAGESVGSIRGGASRLAEFGEWEATRSALVDARPHLEELRDAEVELQMAAHAAAEAHPVDPARALRVEGLEGMDAVAHLAYVEHVPDACDDVVELARLPDLDKVLAHDRERQRDVDEPRQRGADRDGAPTVGGRGKIAVAHRRHRNERQPDRIGQREDGAVAGGGRAARVGFACVEHAGEKHAVDGQHIRGDDERGERAMERLCR